jgi:ribosomal protein L37AE/L43A
MHDKCECCGEEAITEEIDGMWLCLYCKSLYLDPIMKKGE